MIGRPTAPPRDPFADREQAEFIDGLPLDFTHSQVAAACLDRFGERAWPAARIMDSWLVTRKGRLRFTDRDPELARFIRDRAGRFTIDAIRAGAVAKFGSERVPSRTAIADFIVWLRHEAWRRAVGMARRPLADPAQRRVRRRRAARRGT